MPTLSRASSRRRSETSRLLARSAHSFPRASKPGIGGLAAGQERRSGHAGLPVISEPPGSSGDAREVYEVVPARSSASSRGTVLSHCAPPRSRGTPAHRRGSSWRCPPRPRQSRASRASCPHPAVAAPVEAAVVPVHDVPEDVDVRLLRSCRALIRHTSEPPWGGVCRSRSSRGGTP